MAGVLITNTSGPAFLDADLADLQEMHNSLVIATQRGHPAGALETILINTMDI